MFRNIRTYLFLLAALAVSSAAFGQKAAQSESRIKRDLQYLASAQLEGRRTGEQGATYAAGYVANQFAQIKLKPGSVGSNGKANFLQTFPYISGVELGKENSLSLNIGGAPVAAAIRKDWMPLGFSQNSALPQTAIVFAGYGIDAKKDARYNDFAGIDVRGKLILIFDGAPDAGNPHSPFARFDIHTKANIAKENGAAGILVIAESDDFAKDRLAKLSYDRMLGETAVPVAGISRALAQKILNLSDGEQLAEIAKWTAMKKDAPEGIRVEVVGNKPATASIKIELEKQTVDAYNVIGILEGRDPRLKREAIVIGAHYDHLGRGGAGSLAANSTDIHFGADDNASGTSAIMELARRFAKEKNNKRTIIFIAFGGEEEGLLGSKYYTEHPIFPIENTVAMINLDMVGRLKDNKLTVGGMGTAKEWNFMVKSLARFAAKSADANDEQKRGQIIAELKQRGINSVNVEVANDDVTLTGYAEKDVLGELLSIVGETKPRKIDNLVTVVPTKKDVPGLFDFDLQLNEDGFGPSDHSSFYAKKIPVLFFFTGTHLDYHKPSDTAEKINYDGLLKITDYIEQIARDIDAEPQRPTYAVAKSSAMGGRRGFNVSLGTIPSYGDSTDGLVLDGVRDGSPAAKAGLKGGDKVIKLAGHDIRNVQDYTFVLGEMKAGEEYEVVVIRGMQQVTLKIIPAPATPR